uniref:Selenoprotein M n=1 Tax=Sus scrofa TaxID=9823 RepID=A0A8W4FJJ8_PIG
MTATDTGAERRALTPLKLNFLMCKGGSLPYLGRKKLRCSHQQGPRSPPHFNPPPPPLRPTTWPTTTHLNTISSHNLVMKHLPGADPELVLLGHRFEELERIPLSDMTREEINALVQELGFYRKAAPEDPVPPEYMRAPARPAEGAPDRADL